jgi:hypothetical protein
MLREAIMRFKKRYSVLCLLTVAVLLFNGCTKEDNLQTRHFRMGFTPMPEELASNELEYAYSKLAAQADIVNYNLDGGVPWQESFDGKDYNADILADCNLRRRQAAPGQKIYVSVTPLNTFRNGLANYRGPSPNMTLAPPWSGYSFNADPVKEAYLNYCRRVIDFFQPDYFAMGIETNLLYLFRPEVWTDYLDLQEYVYKELKRSYPTLPVFSSISGAPVLNNFIQNIDHVQQKLAALQVLEYSDYFAVSFYPRHGVFDVKRHAGDIIDELFSLSLKPMVVAETGYSAETFSMETGKGFSPFAIDPAGQQDFVNNLLIASERWRAGFVIWSTLRGYNQLFGGISATPGQNVASRKSGLYDRAGIPGSALSPWTEWMKRKIAQ